MDQTVPESSARSPYLAPPASSCRAHWPKHRLTARRSWRVTGLSSRNIKRLPLQGKIEQPSFGVMATAVASKPLPPAQKMKRPPPPYLQTSTNGIRAPNPLPSPSSGSKKPSSSGPPFSANSQNGLHTNGTGPRPNRQRKESQRMGEPTGRPQRLATRSGHNDGSQLERRSAKRYPEPYGKLFAAVEMGDVDMPISSSMRITHTPQIQGSTTLSHCTFTSHPFQVRSTRREFQLSFRDANVY